MDEITTSAAESERFELFLPGDEGWEKHQFRMAQRRAEHLSNHGWKFHKQNGPRGTYYVGFGPDGKRIQSLQNPDEKTAFLKAVNHAFDVQFP